jgi:hypothetical protein
MQEARDQQARTEQPSEGGQQSPPARNPADNLTREARIRGGMHSAKKQQRDAFGQFAGRKGTAEDASRTVRGRRARGRTEPTQPGGGGPEEPGETEHR